MIDFPDFLFSTSILVLQFSEFLLYYKAVKIFHLTFIWSLTLPTAGYSELELSFFHSDI